MVMACTMYQCYNYGNGHAQCVNAIIIMPIPGTMCHAHTFTEGSDLKSQTIIIDLRYCTMHITANGHDFPQPLDML